jgi:hypothetical protein
LILVTGPLTQAHPEAHLDFESYPDGSPIPPYTSVTDQFVSEGVIFEPFPSSAYPMIYPEGTGSTGNFGNSPLNIVDVGYRNEPMWIRFVHPDDLSQRVVRFVRLLLGDGGPGAETFRITVYDPYDELIHTETHTTEYEGYWFEHDAGDWIIAQVEVVLVSGSDTGVAFDDLSYDWPIDPDSTTGEGTNLFVDKSDPSAGQMTISYEPACAATGHTIHYGLLENVSTYTYTGQICNIGNDGTLHDFNPGSESYFFLVVGNDSVLEGSYGTDGFDVERPRWVAAPDCPYDQNLANRCDPLWD